MVDHDMLAAMSLKDLRELVREAKAYAAAAQEQGMEAAFASLEKGPHSRGRLLRVIAEALPGHDRDDALTILEAIKKTGRAKPYLKFGEEWWRLEYLTTRRPS